MQGLDLRFQSGQIAVIANHIICRRQAIFPGNLRGDDGQGVTASQGATLHDSLYLGFHLAIDDRHAVCTAAIGSRLDEQGHHQYCVGRTAGSELQCRFLAYQWVQDGLKAFACRGIREHQIAHALPVEAAISSREFRSETADYLSDGGLPGSGEFAGNGVRIDDACAAGCEQFSNRRFA